MGEEPRGDEPRGGQTAGRAANGPAIRMFELQGAGNLSVVLSNHGARVLAVRCRDRSGALADVVLGFDRIDEYVANASLYFGCTVGRVANRIRGASFALDGQAYRLAANEGRHHLHGGSVRSFDKVVWDWETTAGPTPSVTFRYVSPHLEEGYPGTLSAVVTYSLPEAGGLRIDYEATCDRPTPVDLTNHVYWNLHGAGTGTILDHELLVAADRFAPTDADLVPVGSVESVAGGPLDFRTPRPIGERLPELRSTPALGYDHVFVLDQPSLARPAAILHDPCTGRILAMSTTQPALQLYSGNRIPDVRGKGGLTYGRFGALCLEPEHIPDAVHQPSFPSIVLRPGEMWSQSTVFTFGTDAA